MIHPLSAEKLHEYILREQNAYYTDQKIDDIMAPEEPYINVFSRNDNTIKVLFDQANYKILSVSDNVEAISGYTQSDILKLNMRFVFGLLTLEHCLCPYVWAKWNNDMVTKMEGGLTNYNCTFCGVKVKYRNGQIIRALLRYSIVETHQNGFVKIAAVTINDVSHLLKGNFYWGRTSFGLAEKNVHHLVSTDKKDVQSDIISEREKDVLRLIAQGMETKEIARILFISPFTVDNHRRNMITRTGVKDTTALAQICKMAGII